jgi:hypothetical protein
MYEEVDDGLRRVIFSSQAKFPRKVQDEEWTSIELLHATQSVISQVICRLLAGKALSRDSEFTQKVADFSYSVIVWSIILDWCPFIVRPWAAWLLPIEKTKKIISTVLRREMLGFLEKPRTSPQPPILRELMEISLTEDSDTIRTMDEITRATTARVLSITFGAIDPTTVTFSQVVLDHLSQPSSYLAALRVEAKTVLAAHGGAWSFEAVKDLRLMDRCEQKFPPEINHAESLQASFENHRDYTLLGLPLLQERSSAEEAGRSKMVIMPQRDH